jgi:hypothetical protein
MANVTNANVTNANTLSGLLVNARQDAIFAGYENSLYLPGSLISMYNVPAGSVTAQIPKFSAVSASDVSTETKAGTISELDITNVANTGITVDAKTYAVRTLIKDLGGLDAASAGTVLGRAVSEKFDSDVTALFSDTNIASVGYNGNAAPADPMSVDLFAEAVATVREAKFAGQLNCILHPRQIQNLIGDLSTADFAAADAQNQAMRSGLVGSLFGVNIFSSSFIESTTPGDVDDHWTGIMFAEDAFGIAMFRGIEIEAARNAAGLGTDLVASLHAAPVLVDATRAVRIRSANLTA